MLRTNGLAAAGEIPPELARALCGRSVRCRGRTAMYRHAGWGRALRWGVRLTDGKPPTPRGPLAACVYSPPWLPGSGAIEMVAMLTQPPLAWQ